MPAQRRFKPKSEATMAPNRNPKDRPDRSYGANEPGHMAQQQIQREPATTISEKIASPGWREHLRRESKYGERFC
jgi:hypothetical protein